MTLSGIKGDVAETASVFVPASAEVNAAIESALDEKPSWERRSCLKNTDISAKVIHNKKRT